MPRPESALPSPADRIRRQAFALFGRHGFDGVSVGDLAKAAQVSRGALYWHFDGKEGLYLDCLQSLHRLFDECVFDAMRAESDALRALLNLFTGLRRLLTDPRVTQGIAGYWLVPLAPSQVRLIEAQQAFERSTRALIAKVLERGQASGAFDLHGDLPDFADAVIAVVEAVVMPLRRSTPEETTRILSVLARTTFRAYARDPEMAIALLLNTLDAPSPAA
jgi:Transcriptional regulator